MNKCLPALAAVATLVGASFAQTETPQPAEMADVVANARAYEAAYAKGDAGAIAAFFAEDAEFTAVDGSITRGRTNILQAAQTIFLGNQGATLAIAVDSVELLGPDALLEKGSTAVTGADGSVVGANYTSINVKKDGKWKIKKLIETPLPEVAPGEHLSELAFLVGHWEEADPDTGLNIRSKYEWARGGNYLSRSVTVKRGDDVVVEGWQVIGWDPLAEGFRSWTFDSEGGFSEGRWTREGQRWLVREIGYASDGSRSTADNTITLLNNDRMTWQSDNRTLNGEPRPAIGRIEIQRAKGN